MYRVTSIGLLLALGEGGTYSGLTRAMRRGIPVLEFWGLSNYLFMATVGMRFNLPPPNSLWVYILLAGTT